jgi:hypothetical protein
MDRHGSREYDSEGDEEENDRGSEVDSRLPRWILGSDLDASADVPSNHGT